MGDRLRRGDIRPEPIAELPQITSDGVLAGPGVGGAGKFAASETGSAECLSKINDAK